MADTTPAPAAPAAAPRKKAWLSFGGIWGAFKNLAILFSFVVNFVLIIALLLVLPQIPGTYESVKTGLLNPIVGGLYTGFGNLNQAEITRTIEVHDAVAANFPLNLDQNTVVVLTEPVPIKLPATFDMGPVGQINGNVQMALPAGLQLPVHIGMTVPVSQSIPVNLKVGVQIPLSETKLGPQFKDFQTIFRPLDNLMKSMPDKWDDVVTCVLDGGVVVDCKAK